MAVLFSLQAFKNKRQAISDSTANDFYVTASKLRVDHWTASIYDHLIMSHLVLSNRKENYCE
jgi:hypothetical protein